MMRAGHHVGDDLGIRRIRYRRFQHADDSGRARAEPDRFAENGRIAVEPGLPETVGQHGRAGGLDRKSTRLNSSHSQISYAVFCLKKKKLSLTGYLLPWDQK